MGPQDASDRIWLKQSVQFSVAGQVRTIEIALPVRPGTPAEEIERLLRQADAGLEQMTQHLNSKVSDMLSQAKPPIPADPASPARRPPRAQGAEEPTAPVERRNAAGPLASSRVQPSVAGAAAEGGGWSSPSADASAALDRKQFIAEIAVLGLNPRQAMERLGVRTLDGVNLRQALEQLRFQLLQQMASSGGLSAQTEDSVGAGASSPPSTGAAPPRSGPSSRRQTPEMKQRSTLSQAAPAERMLLGSAQENDLLPDDEDEAAADVAPLERSEPQRRRERASLPIPIRGERTLSSLQEQVQAQTLLEKLRRIRGRLNPPSSDNLKAFRYVVEDQIGTDKTAALLQAVWNVSLPDQLNPDQVLECIRWGKDDHFEDEVDMLLKLTASEES